MLPVQFLEEFEPNSNFSQQVLDEAANSFVKITVRVLGDGLLEVTMKLWNFKSGHVSVLLKQLLYSKNFSVFVLLFNGTVRAVGVTVSWRWIAVAGRSFGQSRCISSTVERNFLTVQSKFWRAKTPSFTQKPLHCIHSIQFSVKVSSNLPYFFNLSLASLLYLYLKWVLSAPGGVGSS